MTETIAFEDRIAEQLRAYAAPAARPPRREAVANAVEAARNVHGGIRGGLRWPTLGRQSMAFAAGAAAVVITVVGVGFLSGLPNQPALGDPALTPTVTPTPDTRRSPTAQPFNSDSMWPQSSFDEMQRAQELADAGDPDYTWQVAPSLILYEEGAAEPGDVELVNRFLREVLGWESFLYAPFLESDINGVIGAHTELRYLRCAPGRTNPLYPPGPEPEMGELCAPTLDDLRYETVSLDLAQLDRQGRDGIWVVNEWRLSAPFAQGDPAVVEAQATERLEEFLTARIAGTGAEGHVDLFREVDIPLLYATTTGAPYERYEIERVEGPQWPYGGMTFSTRLFADGDATVVEQEIGGGNGGLSMDTNATTENGQVVALSFASSDGEVTASAPSTWNPYWPGKVGGGLAPDVWFGLLWPGPGWSYHEEHIGFVDPVAYDAWCAAGGGSPLLTAPADAAAIAQQVIADPDFETTAPVAVRIGGLEAVSIDVALAPGGEACGGGRIDISRWIQSLQPGRHLRLYLVDLPEGMSVETLAITVLAREERFEEFIDETAPIIESIEFHPRVGTNSPSEVP